MLLNILRYIRGYAEFVIIGKFPERFINLALKNGVGIFNVLPYDKSLKASAIVSDYRMIRSVARRAGVRLKILRKCGLPFIIHKHRKRYGLLIGSALFVIIIMVMQNFLWDVEVNGLKTLSEYDVRKSLENTGVFEGAFKGSVDIHKAERALQLEYDKIGWMSVNLIGTRAEIEIKEKDSVPEKEYTSDYNNVFSDTDGVIRSIDVRRGTALVKAGSAVSEGQLLVVGTFENAFGGVHFIDADATITAETYHIKNFTLPKSRILSAPAKFGKRYRVSLFGVNVPVTFGKAYGDYTLSQRHYRLEIGKESVPLVLSCQQIVMYEKTSRNYTESDAREILKAQLSLYKLFNLSDTLSISEKEDFVIDDTQYRLSVKLTCLEEIGYKENLVVNPQ